MTGDILIKKHTYLSAHPNWDSIEINHVCKEKICDSHVVYIQLQTLMLTEYYYSMVLILDQHS